jgi:hypothetical protein
MAAKKKKKLETKEVAEEQQPEVKEVQEESTVLINDVVTASVGIKNGVAKVIGVDAYGKRHVSELVMKERYGASFSFSVKQ